MLTTDEKFVPLRRLVSRLGLPAEYLRNLADEGAIPSLEIKGRLRFNPSQVQNALDRLAVERRQMRGVAMADQQTIVEPLLLSAIEAARLLGISRSKLYSMHSAGLLPLPVFLGGCVRWDRDELRAWLSARNPKTGLLPTRQEWVQIQESQK